MSTNSLPGLFAQGRKAKMPSGVTFQSQTFNLLDVLTFIAGASPRQLRAIKIALMQRRRDVSYEVTLKSGDVEQWTVDSPEHMIQILIGERRGISQISKGKESIS